MVVVWTAHDSRFNLNRSGHLEEEQTIYNVRIRFYIPLVCLNGHLKIHGVLTIL